MSSMKACANLACLSVLAMPLPAAAQATTTYNVTAPYPSGRATSPTRIFNVTLDQGASIPWLELGQGTSCAGQTTPALGFIFITLASGSLPCASVITSDGGGSCGVISATFAGVDGNGTPFTGSVTLDSTCQYRRGGGGKGGGGAGTYYTITGGTLDFTQ